MKARLGAGLLGHICKATFKSAKEKSVVEGLQLTVAILDEDVVLKAGTVVNIEIVPKTIQGDNLPVIFELADDDGESYSHSPELAADKADLITAIVSTVPTKE